MTGDLGILTHGMEGPLMAACLVMAVMAMACHGLIDDLPAYDAGSEPRASYGRWPRGLTAETGRPEIHLDH